MSDLRPCPFCGGIEERPAWIQHKDGCFMWMQATGKKGDMIKAWQTRASDAQAEKLAGLLRLVLPHIPPTAIDANHAATHRINECYLNTMVAEALAVYDASKETK